MDRDELRQSSRRYYAGIMLNDAGVEYWQRAIESRLFEGKTMTTTERGKSANVLIPEEWNHKKTIATMRDRWPEEQPKTVTERQRTVTDRDRGQRSRSHDGHDTGHDR
jgi:hypothetical protein